jgi:hypothetical protein
MANIVSVNISEKKGTVKTTVSEIILNEYRVVGDAHVVDCNRQLSLLAVESVKEIILDKIKKNALKYPVEKSKNLALKYTQL